MQTVEIPIQLSKSEEMGFRGLRCCHPYRHEVCPEDSERNQFPRPLARRAARRIMQFEHTTEEIVGWLKDIENPQFILNDVTRCEIMRSEHIEGLKKRKSSSKARPPYA